MRILRSGLVAAAMTTACALSSAAHAECTRIGAVGDGPSKSIATIMSTHGLENLIEARGLKGQGPVKTTCQDGTLLTQCHSSQNACK